MPVFACKTCGTRLTAEDEMIGREVRCPTCMTVSTVPQAKVEQPVPVAGRATYDLGDHDDAGGRASSPPPTRSRGLSDEVKNTYRQTVSRGRRYGFNCQHCSSRLEATEDKAGDEGQCPTCGKTIIIPILDRYGRLIDPMTGKVIKQDPHPVHAYAAAGDRAPRILRQGDGKQVIRCTKCASVNDIAANNCKSCGMPFTMEGTTLEAAGASNGFSVAALVLGIIGLPAFCTVIPSLLAIIFGIIGVSQSGDGGGGKGLAIAGIICGGIGLLLGLMFYVS
jgi:DNA-directed RNA polymerase subunit RPC12/RpoP